MVYRVAKSRTWLKWLSIWRILGMVCSETWFHFSVSSSTLYWSLSSSFPHGMKMAAGISWSHGSPYPQPGERYTFTNNQRKTQASLCLEQVRPYVYSWTRVAPRTMRWLWWLGPLELDRVKSLQIARLQHLGSMCGMDAVEANTCSV